MKKSPCNATLPLKSSITQSENVVSFLETVEILSNITNDLNDTILKNSKKDKKFKDEKESEEILKDLNEKDVVEYLSQDKDNIILVFGQKIYTAHRSEIKSNIKKQENIFVDDTGKKYFQIIGRHLIDEDDIKSIIKKGLSIFNISTLKNVIRVTNKTSPLKNSRSIYSVDPYTKEEYVEMLNE